MKRIHSIDITRGTVMVIMALDHVRDLIHIDSITQSPTNLATTTPILFFTRWITYLCAPIFVFLAGTSAYISYRKNNSISASRSFLLKRGFYLILLELIVVNFLIFFDPGYHTILFEVIAAIGFGFIVLGLLLNASARTIGIIGLVIIFCHNLFPLIPFTEGSMVKTILNPFFNPAAFPMSNRVFVMAYPPIPWLGIMLVGFASGRLFQLADDRRKSLFIKVGLAAILLFVVLRYLNFYGDSLQWSLQKDGVFTFLSFMNVTKYPPSLLFCLITLGVMFIMLAFTERSNNKLSQLVSVYGKVPLFYFLAHFFLIHVIMLAIMFLQGFSWSQMDFASGTFGRPKGVQSGLELWTVYLIWIGVVAVLYKPCFWFGRYKSTHTQWWLKYT
ncbi:MAG TPA: heparan-alpha-glucosaminide N-acetyltransferase domain-containing protein [Segetibacter sp.]|jgi:uncharacterized membrane protein